MSVCVFIENCITVIVLLKSATVKNFVMYLLNNLTSILFYFRLINAKHFRSGEGVLLKC